MNPGGCWIELDSSQRCFTMLSFIKGQGQGDDVNKHSLHACTHLACSLPVPFMHAHMIYLHDLKWLLGHIM